MPGYRFGLGQRQSGDQGRRDFTGLRGFVHVRAPCVEGQAQAREQFAAVGRGRGQDQAHQGWGARARSTSTSCRSMRRRASSIESRTARSCSSDAPSPCCCSHRRWRSISCMASRTGDRKSTRLKLQSLMRISYAVFCLTKKKNKTIKTNTITHQEAKEEY